MTPSVNAPHRKRSPRNLPRLMNLEASDDKELLILAQGLILCGLPYRSVKGTHYIREAKTAQGVVRLTLVRMHQDIELPYGKDRVMLGWITTRAMQTGKPTVSWESASEYLDTFGLAKGGYEYRAMRQSWRRLASASFSLEIIRAGQDAGRNMPILDEWNLPSMKDRAAEADRGLVMLPGMNYYIRLGATLWAHLLEHPLPLLLSIMREFQDEPKAWDFAAFLCWRSYLCQEGSSIARIPWRELVMQLGSQDSNQRRLRDTLKGIIKRLKFLWPECQAHFLRSSVLEIHPPINGVLPVPRRVKA
jgi:hypothetical protein